MNECIFCQIVKGTSPCYKIYEDTEFMAFLDIFPRTKGHTLLIPKKHYQWVYEIPNFGSYWLAALQITKAMQRTMNPTFVTYVTHGLDVPHAHIHILPRKAEKEFVPEIKQFTPEEMKKTAQTISEGLST